jgi:RNA polymerase sigma-70 factor (ECF subfamily)
MGTSSFVNSMPEPLADDLQLLREMRAGNGDAFRWIYERHQGALFRFVLHMTGSTATAEEVTQDVFMHFIRRPRSYDPSKGPLAAYLFGMARNLARRALRNAASDVCFDDAEELDAAPALDVDLIEKLSNSEALDSLRKAVLALPALYREVVVFCDLEEMSYGEAAGLLQCSPGTVASRLHRGHNILRTKLSRAVVKGCARQE